MTTTIDKTQCNTGTKNEQYDLISVVYHTLECAVTYEQYIEDARAVGDDELMSFFEELQSNSCQMAEKGKQLLKKRLS
jgi:hypothetical protein